MFARLSTTLLSVVGVCSVLAVAMPWETTSVSSATVTVTVTATAPATTTTEPASQCDTGDLQCCNAVTSTTDPAATTLLGLLGIVVEGVDVLVGLSCSPLTIIGGIGSTCIAEPVCCEDNNFNGLIAIGCSPVNINL